MNPKLFLAVPAALFILGSGAASAGGTITEAAAMACVNDKWDETEPEKGHKLVDFAGRCINVPNDPAAPKSAGDCVGKYEYMPDGSWSGSGTCTYTFKDGDKVSDSWEEGAQLKEYTYKYHGWHWQVRGRQRRRHLYVREHNGHPRGRHLQGADCVALARQRRRT